MERMAGTFMSWQARSVAQVQSGDGAARAGICGEPRYQTSLTGISPGPHAPCSRLACVGGRRRLSMRQATFLSR